MHTDLITLVTLLRDIQNESIRAEIARMLRKELLEYIPAKPRSVVPRVWTGDAYAYPQACDKMMKWISDNQNLLGTTAFGKIPLIKQLREFGGRAAYGDGCYIMGLKTTKDIIEGPYFSKYITPSTW